MSNNKRSSSIDFFWNQIPEILPFTVDTETAVKLWEAFEQAKAMHKHEIEKAHARGEVTGFGRVNHPQFYADKTPENYCNETFGGNNE